MFRNTTAHAPKIIWEINESDALDIMSTHKHPNIIK